MNTTENGASLPPAAHEKINTNIVTLTRFLTEEQAKHPEATGDFTYAADASREDRWLTAD